MADTLDWPFFLFGKCVRKSPSQYQLSLSLLLPRSVGNSAAVNGVIIFINLFLTFCHCTLIGDFKREDLAQALATVMATDVVQIAHIRHASLKKRCKYVFFCGNFVSHPVMRKLLTEEWLKRDMQYRMFMSGQVSHSGFM